MVDLFACCFVFDSSVVRQTLVSCVLFPQEADIREEPMGSVTFVSRDDQLCFKKNRKDTRGKGKCKKGKKKGKKGQRKRSKKAPSPMKSRKRSVLKASRSASKKSQGAEEVEPGARGSSGKTRKAPKAKESAKPKRAKSNVAAESPADSRAKSKGKGMPKAKAKAKAKALATTKAKAKAKGRASTGQAANAKRKASPPARPSNGTEGVDADMVQRLVDYYDNVKLEMTSPCTLEFKSLAKHHLQNSVHIRYNIYWPRCSCGLTSRALKKDVVTIAYNSPDATAKQNLLVATKSAEQLVPWLIN